MNKIMTVTAAGVCALILTACGGGGGDGSSSTGSTGTSGGSTTYTVTPIMGIPGGAISPGTPVSVTSGATATFTLTPNSGYAISSVYGTCGGTLSGNTYTTNAITGSCNVVANFASSSTSTGTGASIAACYTAPNAVTFALSSTGDYDYTTSRTGPGVLNGVTYTSQTLTDVAGNTQAEFWNLTSSGAVSIGNSQYDVSTGGTQVCTDSPQPAVPLNMQPGQTITQQFTTTCSDGSQILTNESMVFVGFETITLAGKTFTNVCHFTAVDSTALDTANSWIAPGYGTIKFVVSPSLGSFQYNGN